MSIFTPATVPCPSCKAKVELRVVASVNADRRPDLRQAILDRTFQSEPCPKCGVAFRMPPEFTYFDLGRKQWLLVKPADAAVRWTELERQARATFDRAYGPTASKAGQAMGRGLAVRVVFGWGALREKLLAGVHGLDDVALELMKALIVRGVARTPIADDTELRLVEVEGAELVLAWIRAADEGAKQILRVPRSLYDSVASDAAGWADLRKEVSAGAYVDLNRVLVSAS